MTIDNKKECEFKFSQPHFKNGKMCCALTEDLCDDIKFICDKNCRVYEVQQQLQKAEEKIAELEFEKKNYTMTAK